MKFFWDSPREDLEPPGLEEGESVQEVDFLESFSDHLCQEGFGPLSSEIFDLIKNNTRLEPRGWEKFTAIVQKFTPEQALAFNEFFDHRGDEHDRYNRIWIVINSGCHLDGVLKLGANDLFEAGNNRYESEEAEKWVRVCAEGGPQKIMYNQFINRMSDILGWRDFMTASEEELKNLLQERWNFMVDFLGKEGLGEGYVGREYLRDDSNEDPLLTDFSLKGKARVEERLQQILQVTSLDEFWESLDVGPFFKISRDFPAALESEKIKASDYKPSVEAKFNELIRNLRTENQRKMGNISPELLSVIDNRLGKLFEKADKCDSFEERIDLLNHDTFSEEVMLIVALAKSKNGDTLEALESAAEGLEVKTIQGGGLVSPNSTPENPQFLEPEVFGEKEWDMLMDYMEDNFSHFPKWHSILIQSLLKNINQIQTTFYIIYHNKKPIGVRKMVCEDEGNAIYHVGNFKVEAAYGGLGKALQKWSMDDLPENARIISTFDPFSKVLIPYLKEGRYITGFGPEIFEGRESEKIFLAERKKGLVYKGHALSREEILSQAQEASLIKEPLNKEVCFNLEIKTVQHALDFLGQHMQKNYRVITRIEYIPECEKIEEADSIIFYSEAKRETDL